MDAFEINPPYEQNITDAIETNFMPYAMSVIVSRALPEIDGFKPSHRKILYTMYLMKLLTGNRTKSANVVGQTMKLNPHGDQAIYATLVRLTKGNMALLHPFIDSKGNFGKQYSRDMAYAAARYTEVKLDSICEEIFRDIEKNTVDFVDNYDGTMQEPELLPVTFPNVLVNPNQGIAVGMASNICSFNLEEVCKATIRYIENRDINFVDYIKGPDFPTGGEFIYKKDEIESIYRKGRGSFKVRARYRYDKENNCIEIFELPYTTTVEAVIDEIAAAVKSGKVKEITDVRDETDINGLKLALEIRKSVDADSLMKKLYKITSLEDTFACNFNVLVNGTPKVMGIREIVDTWLDFRVSCVTRAAKFDMAKKEARLHLLEGLAKVLLDIDKAVEIIRKTTKDKDVIPNLMKGFGIDTAQAEFIAEIKLRNLNKEHILKMVSETDALRNEIQELKDLCANPEKVNALIAKQLAEIAKKYGAKRKTLIVHSEPGETDDSEDFVEDYNLRVFLTRDGYFKKIPLVSLRTSPQQKLKDEDYIMQEEDSRNKADVLLFSSKCNTYKLRLSDIQDCKPGSLGEYLPNLFNMEEDERILFMTCTADYKGYIIFFYENGKAAKIDLQAYETKTNRKKLTNGFSKASPLVKALRMDEDEELVAISNINKVLIFHSKAISVKSTRSSMGIQVMTSKKGSYLKDVKKLSEVNIEKPTYYRKKSLPAIGTYLKAGDNVSGMEQITLDMDIK